MSNATIDTAKKYPCAVTPDVECVPGCAGKNLFCDRHPFVKPFDPKKQYKCAECGGVFDFGWTDEEAKAEQEANGWGDIPPGFMAVVCDDCYKAMFLNVPVIETPADK